MKIKLPKLPDELEVIFADNPMTWQEAKDWCEEQGGRLPTKFELQALAELGNVSEERRNDFYWSASVLSDNPAFAWGVYLHNGFTNFNFRTNSKSVLCVMEGE